jgi:hypothetical protein
MRQTIISNNEEPKFSRQKKKKKKTDLEFFDNIQTALAFGILKITELGL